MKDRPLYCRKYKEKIKAAKIQQQIFFKLHFDQQMFSLSDELKPNTNQNSRTVPKKWKLSKKRVPKLETNLQGVIQFTNFDSKKLDRFTINSVF
jgi:hypothetical protein